MRSFTRALAVRCQHCHVYQGADPDDLTTFDFASDEKPAKQTSRAMLRMTARINADDLSQGSDAAAPKVTCYTCHRGERLPLTDRPEKPPAPADAAG